MEVDTLVHSLMEFLDRSPTAFQAVAQAQASLADAGFRSLDEGEEWSLEPGGRYLLVRNMATIVGVRMGSAPPSDAGYRIVTAHTDSPALKIKPGSESTKSGTLRVSVEVYGGPIYHTWLDRELSIAGSAVVRRDGRPVRMLVADDRSIGIIPNVAIHLNRDVNKGFAYNPQDHLKAILSASRSRTGDGNSETAQSALCEYLGGLLSVPPGDVLDFDLYLCDRRKASVAGLERDLLVSGRLDNLAMCHAAISALVEAGETETTQVAVLFDSEEIGSRTLHGAASSLVRDVIERIGISAGGEGAHVHRALARSAMVSGDAAHAVHPSFADKHDEHYQPELNGGPVIKINAGQRYTTTAHSAAVFESICAERDVPVQRIIGRSDLASGSTVGPVVSSQLGIPSLDIGHPIWAMHSVRETGGVHDHPWVVTALEGFFESKIDWR